MQISLKEPLIYSHISENAYEAFFFAPSMHSPLSNCTCLQVQGLHFENCSQEWLDLYSPPKQLVIWACLKVDFFNLPNCETEAFSPRSPFSSQRMDTVCLCVLFLQCFQLIQTVLLQIIIYY